MLKKQVGYNEQDEDIFLIPEPTEKEREIFAAYASLFFSNIPDNIDKAQGFWGKLNEFIGNKIFNLKPKQINLLDWEEKYVQNVARSILLILSKKQIDSFKKLEKFIKNSGKNYLPEKHLKLIQEINETIHKERCVVDVDDAKHWFAPFVFKSLTTPSKDDASTVKRILIDPAFRNSLNLMLFIEHVLNYEKGELKARLPFYKKLGNALGLFYF